MATYGSAVNGSGSAGQDNGNEGSPSDKSPLSSFNFLKKKDSEKKPAKDGSTPKRRGPKPDSKPALTRRQELNRQAQRTHRERKEQYIKALEQEVLRLKEIFANSTRDRDAVLEENRRLKELLNQHGITYDFKSSPATINRENSGTASAYGPSSSGSISGSYRGTTESSGFSPPAFNQQGNLSQIPQGQEVRNMSQLPNNNRIDYDSAGIDFVLTYDAQGRPSQLPLPYPSPPPQLERPCMDHMQYLIVRSHNVENQPMHHPMENPDDDHHTHMSGHALMATAPPMSHIMETPAEKYPFQMPADLGSVDLSKLLDLSSRLPIGTEGEITPIMAWTMILKCDRFNELDMRDLEKIKSDLGGKVRCYGFGAVLEEFEVSDSLGAVFAEKDNLIPEVSNVFAAQQISSVAVN